MNKFALITLGLLPAVAVAQNGTSKLDLVQTAVRAEQFKTLAAALKAAGLVETLRGKGPFTVFAPTDAAFAKLPRGTVEKLLEPQNRRRLAEILTYHVVAGRVDARTAVRLARADTLQGEPLGIRIVDGRLSIGGATVVTNDVAASNGVIHVIDRVLIPEAASEPLPLTQREAMVKVLVDAIEVGVPLFNRGDEVECASVYRIAVFAILELGSGGLRAADQIALRKALTSDPKDGGASAWALRRAMDQTLLSLLDQRGAAKKIGGSDMETKDVFKFDDPGIGWRSLNDDVMGGISRGQLVFDDRSRTAIFKGTLSLENNGGFSSVRSPERGFELAGYEGLLLRVRGDGRTYKLRATGRTSRWGGGYQKEFMTRAGEWQEVRVPFADMKFSWRGRAVRSDKLVGADVRGIGLMIADNDEVPFALEIDWIKGYRTSADASAQ